MRDNRLDIIRGVALVTIVINHMGGSVSKMGMVGMTIPTPTTRGWSSAAELFVLMSGYMVGLVYMNKADGSKRLLHRCLELFKHNGLMFLAIAPFTLFAPPVMLTAFRLDTMAVHPIEAILLFPVFLYSPRLLDILQLYIVFMAVAAMSLPFISRRPVSTIAISVSLYTAVQVLPFLDPAMSLLRGEKWTFNFLAWQVLFFTALVAGKHRLHVELFSRARRWYVFLPAAAALIAIAVLKVLADRGILPPFAGTEKGTLGVLRLVHGAALLTVYAGLVEALGSYRNHWVVDSLASIGRNSLNCFILSVVGTYVLAYVWYEAGAGWTGYVLITGALLVAVRAGAYVWDRAKAGTMDRASSSAQPAN